MTLRDLNAWFSDAETRTNNQAIADPTKPSTETERIARFLAIMLEYDWETAATELMNSAQWLLRKARGDTDGLWEVLEEKAEDPKFLKWALSKNANIYGVRKVIANAYTRHLSAELKRAEDNTTEGRKKRYVTHPEIKY